MAAPILANDWNTTYGPNGNDNVFFVSSYNWGLNQPYAYNEDALANAFPEFNYYTPFYVVIGAGYQMYYGWYDYDVTFDSHLNAKVWMKEAIAGMNGEISIMPFEDTQLYFGDSTAIDISFPFISPLVDYTTTLGDVSDPIITAEKDNDTLSIKAGFSADSLTTVIVNLIGTDSATQKTNELKFFVKQFLHVKHPLANITMMPTDVDTIAIANVFAVPYDSASFTYDVVNSDESIAKAEILELNDSLYLVVNGVVSGNTSIKLTATYNASHGVETASQWIDVKIQNTDTYWCEYGQEYIGYGSGWGGPSGMFIEWDFGDISVCIDSLEFGYFVAENDIDWRVVEFDENANKPSYDSIIGDLNGTVDCNGVTSSLDVVPTYVDVQSTQKVTGHVAIGFTSQDNYPITDVILDPAPEGSNWSYLVSSGEWLTITNWAYYIRVKVDVETGIYTDPVTIIPGSVKLSQNYPNPFNPTTTIKFFNNANANVKLTITNSNGEIVKTLVNGKIGTGFHSVKFDASHLNSGVYFYTLKTLTKTITKKMILIK